MKKLPSTRPDLVPPRPEIPDPVCAHACGRCWACRRKTDGPLWFLAGPPYPKGRVK